MGQTRPPSRAAAQRKPDTPPPHPRQAGDSADPATPPPEKAIKPVAKSGHYTAPTDAEIAAAKTGGTQIAIIKTEEGDITAELYGAETPMTVANFIKLANAHFYDGLSFHRVEPGFVIQGGDPKGNGSGGPGYTIKLEISKKLHHDDGALAMARTE